VGRVEKAEKKVIGLEIYSIKGNKKKMQGKFIKCRIELREKCLEIFKVKWLEKKGSIK